jgi:hypothetical protein
MMRVSLVSLVLALLIAVPGTAQEPAKPPAAPAAPEGAKGAEAAKADKPAGQSRGQRPGQLRVQVVVTRTQGERRVSSAPYSFLVSTDAQQPNQRWSAQLKMGVEIPVSVAQIPAPEAGKSGPFTSFQYRNVGTNIECGAQALADGLYQLRLSVENSSVYQGPESRAPGASAENPVVADRPLFRSFVVNMNPILRDGESVQTVASTDPVTGEVVKIDVTVNIVK